MIRYQIEMIGAGKILDGSRMIVAVAASSFTTKPDVVVYIDETDREKFEKLVEGDPNVARYVATPERARKEAAR